MAKSCPNCLRKVEDEGRAFCPYCGEPMQEDLKRIMDARKIAEGQPVKETKAPEPPKTKKPIEPQKGDDGFTAHHVKKKRGMPFRGYPGAGFRSRHSGRHCGVVPVNRRVSRMENIIQKSVPKGRDAFLYFYEGFCGCASRWSFFRSIMVSPPRNSSTIPSAWKYLSIRVTTSRALPRWRAISSCVICRVSEPSTLLWASRKMARRWSKLANRTCSITHITSENRDAISWPYSRPPRGRIP